MKICTVCQRENGVLDPYYGWLPCLSCRDRQSKLQKPGSIPEFVPDSMKEDRKKSWDDIHPAHNKGEPSREFRERYGTEAMKRQGFTDKEIKGAKYVWNDDLYYKKEN